MGKWIVIGAFGLAALGAGLLVDVRAGVEVAAAYGLSLAVANNAHLFTNSRRALERIANNAAAKATDLVKKGKG